MSDAPDTQAEKRAQVLLYESADCFSDAERAAIALALAAGEALCGNPATFRRHERTFLQASDNPNDCRHIRLRIFEPLERHGRDRAGRAAIGICPARTQHRWVATGQARLTCYVRQT